MEIDIPLIFKGESVTIVGGGSSLTGFDFGKLKGKIVVTNHAVRYTRSDMWVFLDTTFIRKNMMRIRSYKGYCVSRHGGENIHTIKFGSSEVDFIVRKANNSGFTAMVLALMLGAKRVYLLGFDGSWKDKSHFHSIYRDKKKMEDFTRSIYLYDHFRNFPIVNVGLDSDIDCFKKVSLEENFYNQ